jgi:hypothetical protein
MATLILKCRCQHDYQDRRYGYGLRVHNGCKSGTSGFGWRCTVCGNVQEMRAAPIRDRDEE